MHLSLVNRLKRWARDMKRDTVALYLAARHPRTPWYAKLLAVAVAGYAFSPLDLIPDFIPVLGHLDDLILLPLGVYLVVRLIPPELMAELRDRAATVVERPVNRSATAAIVCLWAVLIMLILIIVGLSC